jgi:dihydroorotate dehydrogenase (fumarate)
VLAAAGGADLVELNLGCPNVWDDGQQKRIMSFDPELVAGALRAASEAGAPVGVKLSPLSDPVLLAEVAAATADAGARFVVSCNTFPNGLALRTDGRPAVDVGFGGVSGGAMKPIALGQISQLRAQLPEAVDLVGCGGVRGGDDVRDLLAVGAAAVGLATAFWDAGEAPGVFGDLLADWLG